VSKQVIRDVKDRGRDVEGCLKQWFGFVKPNFVRYVEPQKKNADIIVQRGIENKIAMGIPTFSNLASDTNRR
jgi:uridine kinase